MLTTSGKTPAPVTLGGGNQSYYAPPGAYVQAGSGHDTVDAASGSVTVTGSSGSLTFIGGTGPCFVSGGEGSLTVFGSSGGGVYTGGTGHNLLESQGAVGAFTALVGSSEGDILIASSHRGADTLNGGVGGETLIGGNGPTDAIGRSDLPTQNFPWLGSRPDTITGGSGTMTVQTAAGDKIYGGAGTMNVIGSSFSAHSNGTDTVIGGSGTLNVNALGEYMIVTGGSGALNLTVGGHDAKVIEGSGKATYDVINGKSGGSNNIYGFKVGKDTLDFKGYGGLTSTIDHGNTYINLSDGTRIALMGVTSSIFPSIHFG